jgi:hypothetical protein
MNKGRIYLKLIFFANVRRWHEDKKLAILSTEYLILMYYRGPWDFLPSYDLAPSPSPPPPPVRKLFLFLGLPMSRRSSLLTGEGRGKEPNQFASEKAWSSIIQ